MNAQKYTQKSLEAIQAAQQLTIENQNQQIEQVHLLASLIRQENGLAPQLLRKMGVTVESLDAAVLQELGKLPRVTGSGREADRYYVARPVDEALNRAEKLADEMKDDFVSVEHLLLALIETADSTLKRLFSAYNITKERFLQALQSVRGNQRVTSDSPEDLLAPAEFGKFSVTTAEEHDRMIAFTSQLAHVVSNAYIKSPTAGSHKGFSAGSYKDMTRVAWLNPQMWAELFLENRDYLMQELSVLSENLAAYQKALETQDLAGITKLLDDGKRRKEEVDGR